MLFSLKIVTFYLEKLHHFNSSDGCNDADAQAEENPCIVGQVSWWNNGVLDAVESKTWLAWPIGKLVIKFIVIIVEELVNCGH